MVEIQIMKQFPLKARDVNLDMKLCRPGKKNCQISIYLNPIDNVHFIS